MLDSDSIHEVLARVFELHKGHASINGSLGLCFAILYQTSFTYLKYCISFGEAKSLMQVEREGQKNAITTFSSSFEHMMDIDVVAMKN